jgi:hypothetical protein
MKELRELKDYDIESYFVDLTYSTQKYGIGRFTTVKLHDGRWALLHKHPTVGKYFCEVGDKKKIDKIFMQYQILFGGEVSENIHKRLEEIR